MQGSSRRDQELLDAQMVRGARATAERSSRTTDVNLRIDGPYAIGAGRTGVGALWSPLEYPLPLQQRRLSLRDSERLKSGGLLRVAPTGARFARSETALLLSSR
jgi:hypothetical protein